MQWNQISQIFMAECKLNAEGMALHSPVLKNIRPLLIAEQGGVVAAPIRQLETLP